MLVSKIFILSLFVVVFLNCCECRRRKPSIEQEDKDEEDVKTISYKSKEDLDLKLKELNSEKQGSSLDEELDENEKANLEKEEKALSRALSHAVREHGENSDETALSLHKLGRAVYKLKKYEKALDISKRIVKIYEELHGKEHRKTADALGNLASAAFRLSSQEVCEYAMQRMMYILLKTHAPESKEVILHRARMLTFQIEDGETTQGLSYKEAKKEYRHLEL